MARARKSAIGVLAGARSFVWRHSSYTTYTYVQLSHSNMHTEHKLFICIEICLSINTVAKHVLTSYAAPCH